MGTVGYLTWPSRSSADCGGRIPILHKTVTCKLAATVAPVLQTQTANTGGIAAVLPIEIERTGMRSQWMARVLADPLLDSVSVMEPITRPRARRSRPAPRFTARP